MRQISATTTVATTPDRVFELLTDPDKHALLDGSGTVRAARDGSSQRLELGSTFGMDMKMGAPYRVRNTVVEFEQDRLIAWRHFAGHRWRWQLRPLGDSQTEVTETFDWSTARIPALISVSPAPKKNKESINATLRRLEEMFPA